MLVVEALTIDVIETAVEEEEEGTKMEVADRVLVAAKVDDDDDVVTDIAPPEG